MSFRLALCVLLLSSFSLEATHVFQLRGGGEVRGDIAWEGSDSYFVDLGYDVIEVAKSAVVDMRELEGVSDIENEGAVSDEIYGIGALRSERSIRHWANEHGEAVVLVQTPTGLGSGFVVHQDGYVVTNNHVIAGEHRISVTVFQKSDLELTKDNYDNVRIVATSADLDLALLKIETQNLDPFLTVPLARDDGELIEGQTVFAIGSPLGLDRTVSEGIVSVANRVIGGRLYLQTTTQINPGNSGGPLFNLKGEVVGVNNMKIAAVGAEGLGFAISSRILKSFLDNLEAYAFDSRNPNSGFRYLTPPTYNSKF